MVFRNSCRGGGMPPPLSQNFVSSSSGGINGINSSCIIAQAAVPDVRSRAAVEAERTLPPLI
jgi:hypothetical protein